MQDWDQTVHDERAHQEAERLLRVVENLQEEAKTLLKTHPNEDLETAIRALEISKGSLSLKDTNNLKRLLQ